MHLTRPFTINQLKELLLKYGSLKSNEKKQPAEPLFWIDAVKSHCYVAYDTQSDAEQARLALNNLTWPASNPKQLSVDFSSMDEIVDVIEHDGKVKINPSSSSNGDRVAIEKERKIREWDLHKLNEKDGGAVTTNGKGGASRRKEEEEMSQGPPKTLDDLFRKTNAAPFIYWLPLSQEQVAEKMREEERMRAVRDARIAALSENRRSGNTHTATSPTRTTTKNEPTTEEVKKEKVHFDQIGVFYDLKKFQLHFRSRYK